MIKEQTHLETSISTYKRKHHFHLKWEYIAVPIMAMLGVGLIMVVAGLADSKEATPIRISEVCPHNFNLAADCSGNCSDYIELCNESNAEVNLSDYYLSDDEHDPAKFRLPDIKLRAGECIIVWADGTEVTCECANEIHANFRLSDGEVAVLTSKNRDIIDFVSLVDFPDNVSATKLDGQFVKAYGTPGVNNNDCKLYQPAALDMPIFSLSSGFYPTDSITLEINVPEGVTVYYTTDGSIPDETSTVYSEALILTDVSCEPNRYVNIRNTVPDYDNNEVNNEPVNKANVIRAVAVDDSGNFSEVKTATYFVGEIAKEYEGYAVLSIVSEPEGLFGDNGICVTGKTYDEWYNNTDRSTEAPTSNFSQHGPLWEREASIQFWNVDKEFVLSQNCGIRVQGNAARNVPTKRFSIIARELYSGNDLFDANIFGDSSAHSLYLRYDGYDVVIHELMKERDSVAVQRGIPTVLFLNGEFYAKCHIREKYDEQYFAEHYGVDADDVVIISDSVPDSNRNDDLQLYTDFLNYINTHDCADPDVYANVCEQIDVQSFIDFMCVNFYINNNDWSLYKNFKMWRTRTTGGDGYADGKWRWCIYDVDIVDWTAYVLQTRASEIDPFAQNLPYTSHNDHNLTYLEAPIFSRLIKNDDFKQQFVLTYFDLMNTYLSKVKGETAVKTLGVDNIKMWGYYFDERPVFAAEQVIRHLGLSGECSEITIQTTDTMGGCVRVNTSQVDFEVNEWTGTYVTDYPICFTAAANDGWQFVGWQGDLSSSEQSISVDLGEEGLYLKAVFVREGSE